MLDKNLAKAIINVVVFFEFSNEEVLDPDASIEAIEQFAADLQHLPVEIRMELCNLFHELSGEYGDREQFVNRLPETLGLV